MELESFVQGKWLGGGICRNVYVFRPDPSLVIKVGIGENGRKHNLIESRIWEEVSNWDEVRKWFAPVIDVSESGLYLLMKRVEIGRKQDYPRKVPHFFTDLKYNNYGWLNDQLVSCDYANTILTQGFTKRFKVANWWD